MFRFDAATSRLHLEEDGASVGSMEILDDSPREVVFAHPRVKPGADAVAVAGTLVEQAARRAVAAGVRDVKLRLDDRARHVRAFVAAAPSWGFALVSHKVLVRATRDELRFYAVRPLPSGAEFVPGDPQLWDVLRRVLVTSSSPSERVADPFLMVAGFTDRCRAADCLHPQDWVVMRVDGRAVGVVFPAFVDAGHAEATNLYLGVVSEARRHGFGIQLLRHGVETMLRRGATSFVGSCDVGNTPMRRAFERIGCARVATRRVFTMTAGSPQR